MGSCPAITSNGAKGAFVDELETWSDYANDAYDAAQDLLQDIADLNLTAPSTHVFPAPTVDPLETIGDFTKPDEIAVEVTPYANPEEAGIGPLSLDDVDITLSTKPEFTDSPPALNIPAAPADLTEDAPDGIPTISSVTLPDSPDVTLPSVPTLEALDLPAVPTITLPTFSGTLPTFTDAAPGDTFSFSESDYSSTLLTDLQNELISNLLGGTGLPDSIWDQIWSKARTRELRTGAASVQRATEEWSARGFTMPGGMLDRRITEARQKVQDAENQLSRDIAIQQAQMEVENMRFTIEQGIRLEGTLIDMTMQKNQRALEAQRFAFQATIDIFNSKINLYNAQLQGYATEAQVYRDLVQAELAEIEIYKAQLEGQRLVSEINQQEIEIYKTRIEALLTSVELYKAELQGVITQVEVDKARVDAFRAQVDAYGQLVAAKTAEFQGYAERIRGESYKTDIFQAQVQAYNAKVFAYQAESNAKIGEANAKVNIEELKVREYLGNLDKYKTDVQAELTRLQAQVAEKTADVQRYIAESGSEAERVKSDALKYESHMRRALAETELLIKSADMNLQNLNRGLALELEQEKVKASVQSQLAAAALSAVSLSAQISESVQESKSCTTSYDGDKG